MVILEILTGEARDGAGNILEGAEVTLRVGHAPGGALASLFSNPNGTGPLANPLTATDGTFTAYAQPGDYRGEGTSAVGSGFVLLSTRPLVGKQYATRDEAGADVGYAPANGTVITAGGFQYVRSAGATALPGLTGWLPFGPINARHHDGLAAALAAGGTEVNVTLPESIPETTSVPANMTLMISGAGSISILSGASLSFNNRARLSAPRRQVFTGDGSVSNLREVWPEWFGVVNSSVSAGDANQTAWQKAADACSGGGIISLAAGNYPFDGSGPIQFSAGQVVKGIAGTYSSTIRFVGSNAVSFGQWTAFPGGGVEGVVFSGISVTPSSGTIFRFEDALASRGNLKDISVIGPYNVLNLYNVNTFTIDNFKVFDIYNSLFAFVNTENVEVSRVFTNAGDPGAPGGQVSIQNKAQNVNFRNCNFSRGAFGLNITNDDGMVSRGNDFRWNTFDTCNFDGCHSGVDINNCEQNRFVNCWFSSNGRELTGGSPGNGVHIRGGARHLQFIGGVASNNGQRGFRIDPGAKDIHISHMEIAGNSVNTDNGFANVDVYGGVSDWSVKDCIIGGMIWAWDSAPPPPARGGPAVGVQVRNGVSDRYDVTGNRFIALATPISDGGSGTDKDVTTGNRSRSAL